MTAIELLGLVGAIIAWVGASLRWLRVAQREHYLFGSASRFAGRWWRTSGVNLVGLAVAFLGVVLCVIVPWAIFFAVMVIALCPVGLSLRGRSATLRWTRRLRTLALLYIGLSGVVVACAALIGGIHGGEVGAGIVALLSPIVVDASLFVLAPIEQRLGRRFVVKAEEKVRAIEPKIVAITGSYGKTSTKGYVAHLLSERFQVLASPRSFNNQAGLSRTVNELLVPGTDILVAEMGTYGVGEIATMCRWLPPSVAVITAIGPVHLERFKSLDRILEAKSEIVDGAQHVVLNVDDPRLAAFAAQLMAGGKTVVACSAHRRDAAVAVIDDGGQTEVLVGGAALGRLHLPQGIAPSNVASAVGAAIALGCTNEEIFRRLSGLPIAQHRLEAQSSSSGATIIDDTFNSNPTGARFALSQLAALGTDGHRRVVVTPGMVELGTMQFGENVSFAREAGAAATDVVIIGQTNRRALRSGLGDPASNSSSLSNGGSRHQPNVYEFATREAAVAFVATTFGPGDVVLYENDLPDHYP